VNDYYYDNDDDGHHHHQPHHHIHHQIVAVYEYNLTELITLHTKKHISYMFSTSLYLSNVSCSVKLCSLTWQDKDDHLGWQTNVEKIITKYIV
jgi:hypothetical protein